MEGDKPALIYHKSGIPIFWTLESGKDVTYRRINTQVTSPHYCPQGLPAPRPFVQAGK